MDAGRHGHPEKIFSVTVDINSDVIGQKSNLVDGFRHRTQWRFK